MLDIAAMIACLPDPFLNGVGHVTLATTMRDQLLPLYHYLLVCDELEIRQPKQVLCRQRLKPQVLGRQPFFGKLRP